MSSPEITPDQAIFILGLSLPALKVEHATTKHVIEAIPLDKGDYRPDPVSKSALELAWHIVAAEKRFLSGIPAGAFDFNPIARPDSARNSADIARWFDDMFATNISLIERLNGGQLARIMDFRGILKLPAVGFIQFALNHTIHHRGQLSAYLRPMGAKIPSIYGESHDSAQARMSAQSRG
jgi:uncharacterized damage-inducible protein DinB